VQCKACESNVLKHLRKAVEDFLPHLEFWKDKGVEKFIVAVGCGVDETRALDAKREYEAQFNARGLTFELWDSSEIRRQLRPMRLVVEQFLPRLLNDICGTPSPVFLSPVASGSAFSLSPALITELGTTHHKRLDEIRDLIRAGDETAAESELRQMPSSAAWELLPPELKARAFRLLIGIVLNRRSDIAEARTLLARAKEAHPGGRFVVTEAVILNADAGPTAALNNMPDAADRDEWNLRAALLLNAGRADEAITLLQAPAFEPDPDTLRLRALAHLYRRDVPQAKAAAAEAASRAPDWLLVQQAVALAEYFAAIAPSFEGWNHWLWPLPLDWHLVRSDRESRKGLQRASELFAAIAQKYDRGSADWQNTISWQLACLANDSATQREAAELASDILTSYPAAVPVIVWALARDFPFPENLVRSALEELCKRGATDTQPVQALFSLLAGNKNFAEASRLLEQHQELYARAGLGGPWRFQLAQVYMAAGDAEKARATLAELSDPDLIERTRVALARIESFGSGWTPERLAQLDAEVIRTRSDDTLFAACEAHHFAGMHEYVVERADDLVRRFRTEPALRLTLDACAASKDYEKCLALMERYRTVFRDAVFPQAIRRLRVACLRELGRLLRRSRSCQHSPASKQSRRTGFCCSSYSSRSEKYPKRRRPRAHCWMTPTSPQKASFISRKSCGQTTRT
jgi:tetratricopeptide (TPR) repeat protein